MSNEIEKSLGALGFETTRLDKARVVDGPVWGCKIGLKKGQHAALPGGCDAPMRQAVEDAFKKITGQDADFCFSGWGESLTKLEMEIVSVEACKPAPEPEPEDECAHSPHWVAGAWICTKCGKDVMQ